jgi:outer membrane lipoprotein carrier protein
VTGPWLLWLLWLCLCTPGTWLACAWAQADTPQPAATQPAASQPATTQPAAPEKLTPATPEFLKELQDHLREVNSVQADFTQVRQLAIFDHTVTIRGRFALQKPDRMIWVVDSPVKYAVSLIGQELRQWDQDSGKIQTMDMGGKAEFQSASDQLKAWFLGDYHMLTEIFNVSIRQRQPLTLVFLPKPDGVAAQFLERVDLTFGENGLAIQSVVAREPGGDVTTIEFTHTQINKPIKPGAWDLPPHE